MGESSVSGTGRQAAPRGRACSPRWHEPPEQEEAFWTPLPVRGPLPQLEERRVEGTGSPPSRQQEAQN